MQTPIEHLILEFHGICQRLGAIVGHVSQFVYLIFYRVLIYFSISFVLFFSNFLPGLCFQNSAIFFTKSLMLAVMLASKFSKQPENIKKNNTNHNAPAAAENNSENYFYNRFNCFVDFYLFCSLLFFLG